MSLCTRSAQEEEKACPAERRYVQVQAYIVHDILLLLVPCKNLEHYSEFIC